MKFEEFTESLRNDSPPNNLNQLLLALWYDAKGDWESSHNIAQDLDTPDGASIHAYLHRKEGDIWNADYWYRRAGSKRQEIDLEKEWRQLASAYLTK